MSYERELVDKIRRLLRRDHGDDSEPALRAAFRKYDRDGDGRIDAEELSLLLADADVGNRLTRRAWIRGIMDRLDTDGDEGISWDEFVAAVFRDRPR